MERKQAYSITAAQLAERGRDRIPEELISSKNLIYSSPATLAFNSPGAQGFGVKRAGLAIPGSVMLLLAPGCCGRNTTILSELGGYADRFFYQIMDETDIVTGRHLKKVPQAVEEVYDSLETKPSVIMICLTCVDALLGTDMERICRKAQKAVGIPVLPCYMYALTREGRHPPMVHVRQSIYSLLAPRAKKSTSVNLLGHFAPLTDDCELYALLRQIGVKTIREISQCETYEEYQRMAEANFNLVLNPEARAAAKDLQKRLGIPSIELARLYQLDKVKRQYELFGAALGVSFDDGKYYDAALSAKNVFQEKYPDAVFSVGEGCNANPFELALALLRDGFSVAEIFANLSKENFVYLEKIAALSPQTKIYSNLNPTMIYYEPGENPVDIVIGKDAVYYHPEAAQLAWSEDVQPFGYAGVRRFYEACGAVLEKKVREAGESQCGRSAVGQGETSGISQCDYGVVSQGETSGKSQCGHSAASQGETSGKPPSVGKGLRKYIAPFAPDQSGAAAVFCELHGLTVILDAGGCAGNICGFDEPRWFGSRSAIFSAGLRDMDAILGRDDRLVEKVVKACEKISGEFIALIGTPVPAVIGTDYRALARMIEKKTGIPAIAINTDGTKLYDEGAEKAWTALFQRFAGQEGKLGGEAGVFSEEISDGGDKPDGISKRTLGILGMTPLSFGGQTDSAFLKNYFLERGFSRVYCYGMGDGIEAVKNAAHAEKNIVVSPEGLEAAKYLYKKFGTPYEVFCPPEIIPEWDEYRKRAGAVGSLAGKKILIVHQQVLAESLRREILARIRADVTVATWFMVRKEGSAAPSTLEEQGEALTLREEDDWISLVETGGYDVIIADPLFKRAVPKFSGEWWALSHFAVSGKR